MSDVETRSIPASISDLIDRWASIVEFQKDVGCGYEAARKFRDRESIPVIYWERVIDAALRKGVPGIDWEWLGREMAKNKS